MYSNEAMFSRSLSTKLKDAGLNVVRIESHSTGNGIPDMFVQGYGKDLWLELKCDSKIKLAEKVTVSWRPGQQAWHNKYFLSHACHKQVVTLMSVSDGVYIIPMECIYFGGNVYRPFHIESSIWNKKIHDTELVRLMLIASHNISYRSCKTYRDMVIRFFDEYYRPDFDYDPEVIWSTVTEFLKLDAQFTNSNTKQFEFKLFEAVLGWEEQQVNNMTNK